MKNKPITIEVNIDIQGPEPKQQRRTNPQRTARRRRPV